MSNDGSNDKNSKHSCWPESSLQRYGVYHRGSTGFPEANGSIPFDNGFLSEILLGQGYHTYIVAKWHLTPAQSVPQGKATPRYVFEPTGKPDIPHGKGTPGRGQLYINT
jgi:arylsulfatase A-like enzyme